MVSEAIKEVKIKFRAIVENEELRKRILYTLLMFMVARIGIHIAVPGLRMDMFNKSFGKNEGITQMLNLFSGGAIQKASIFSLGIAPYINASIMFSLLGAIIPKIEEMQREGGKERDRITQWSRYVTIGIAIAQSIGVIVFLESQNLVIEPNIMFRIRTITLMTGGTAFLMWLAERISIKGTKNGTSALIFLNIISGLPQVFIQMFLNLNGGLGKIKFVLSIILFLAIIVLMVIIQLAERRIPIQYAGKTKVGTHVGQKTFLPFKLNMPGVMPIIFASVFMAIPPMLINLLKNGSLKTILTKQFSQTGFLYLLMFSILIVMFSFVYVTMQPSSDPEKIAENLKKSGAVIPQKRPGAETAEYLEGIMTRITFGSAIFLAILGIFPNIWFGYFLRMDVLLSGTSLLILIGVAVEVLNLIETYVVEKNYKGFVSK